MSRQVLKRQLEAFTATNIDAEIKSKDPSQLNDQNKKIKRKKRQLTLAEQIKKESEKQSNKNHTAENMRYLLFSSSRVAAAVKKSTKKKTEDELYKKYSDKRLNVYLKSLKKPADVSPEERRAEKARKEREEREANVDTLYDSVMAGELNDDDLGSGTGLKGRSKDGYQYGNSTKRIKKQF